MRKKIIFFAPNIEDGGIEKNIILLSDYFIKQNNSVQIVYTKLSSKIKKKLNKKLILSKSTFNMNYFFNVRVNNSINCFFYFLKNLKKEKNSVILSFQDHPFSIVTGLIKRIPCIIRIANHPFGSLSYFNNRFLIIFKIFIKLFFYQFSDIIISNSLSSTNFFRKYIFNSKKCLTIYNPIKLKNNFKKFKRNKNLLLSIGRLHKQKNFDCLIRSMAIIAKKKKNIKLIILGKGQEKKKLIQLRNKLNLTKKIQFFNFNNPNKFYKRSGIFVLSSLFEGLPNVLLESMSYGLPIVSTNCLSGPKEILENNKYGYLCNVDDHRDLAKKILFTNKNYKDALIKIENGRKNLLKYDYDVQCKKYIQTIYSL